MNKDVLESNWVQIRELLHDKFSNLTDDDIRQINGRYDQLVTKLQQKYGYSREEAEERIKSWNFDRFATTAAPQTAKAPLEEKFYREENVTNAGTSSFIKWLLPVAIAILLLGLYFNMAKVPEGAGTTTPSTTQQQMVSQTASDQAISNGLRDSLMANGAADMQNVVITTNNGVVTLSGTVPNLAARNSIVNSAQNFTGVTQVINHLQIK